MEDKLYSLADESYFIAIALLLFISLLLTFFMQKYKKALKVSETQINEKDEKIKTLRQYAYEAELKKIDREHEVEKRILELEHTIQSLETKAKEGLKSQVVLKIETAQNRRERQLKRVNLGL